MASTSEAEGKLVRWELQDLLPGQADLLGTLDKWYEPQAQNGDHPLRDFYRYGLRLHQGQLAYWRRRDRARGTRWESRAVARLFSVRAAVLARGCALFKSVGIRTIEMMQCQPCGGIWQKDRPGNGWHCKTWMCPWCYLRRFDELRKFISFEEDRLVTQAGVKPEYERQPGLGFGDLVNVTIYRQTELWDESCFLLGAVGLSRFIASTDTSVRRKAYKAAQRPPLEFGTAMRFLSPIMERAFQGRQDAKVKKPLPVQPCTAGWQMGYIHTTPFHDLPRSKILDGTTIEVSRHEGLTPEAALRLANPWPMRWLNMPDELVRQVDETLCGHKRYGVLHLAGRPAMRPIPNYRQIPSVSIQLATA